MTSKADLQQALAPGSLICLDTNCLLYYFEGKLPWAESLRPVFKAKDDGQVRLFTSSMTLAELLARVNPTEQSAMLSAVRQYFDVVPVSDAIGIHAAAIRRSASTNEAGGTVKTPDAVELATANETRSMLFITNDEQLTRMPQTVKALYLKEIVLDWMEDEFVTCQVPDAPVTVATNTPQRLDIVFRSGTTDDWLVLDNGLAAEEFVRSAMLLSSLVKGPCAVVGLAHGSEGAQRIVALRVLPSARPWLTPPVPDWVKQFTNKKHKWDEPAQGSFIRRLCLQVGKEHDDRKSQGNGNSAMPFVVVSASRLNAETDVDALDGNHKMPAHKRQQEVWRRYLAPFTPIIPLLELPGARLWKAEADNAHEIDVARFRKFFACSENVIGKDAER